MKAWFDCCAEQWQFTSGDQVLVLLPVVGSPFQARFGGPFTVLCKVSEQDCMVAMPKWRRKICHVNLMKPYFA